MKKKKWEHLFISPSYRPPLLDDLYDEEGDLNTGRTRGQTYSSNELFESCKAHMGLSWFYEIPEKNPFVGEHVHDVDELIFFMPAYTKKGDDTNAKWGEAVIYMDGEPYTVTDNTCIYCPAGLKHGPIVYNRIDIPNCFLTVLMTDKYTRLENGKVVDFINGQYVPVADAPAEEGADVSSASASAPFDPLPVFGLNESSTNEEKKKAACGFIRRGGYMIFGTVAMDGITPTTRGLELHFLDDEENMYIGVAKGKPVFYELMRSPYLSGCVTEMTVKDLALSVRINAHVKLLEPSEAPEIYERYWQLNPGTKALYAKDLDMFRIFILDRGEGEIFHLPEDDEVTRVRFSFGEQSVRPWAYEIGGSCTGCGACAEACMKNVITPDGNGKYRINHYSCLECGRCYLTCPNQAIECNFR